MRTLGTYLCLIAMVAALAMSSAPVGAFAQGTGCQYILGFKALHDLDPQDVGACVDNQAFASNGDAQQHTANGLMAWRKADNWTAFTNGYWTWINGPQGLVKRLNTDRFPWEAGAPLPAVPPGMVRTDGVAGSALDWKGLGGGQLHGVLDDAYLAQTIPATPFTLGSTDFGKQVDATPGHQFAIVLLTATNQGDGTEVVSDADFVAHDAQGRTWDDRTAIDDGAFLSVAAFFHRHSVDSLLPGASSRFAFAFLIPSDSTGVTFGTGGILADVPGGIAGASSSAAASSVLSPTSGAATAPTLPGPSPSTAAAAPPPVSSAPAISAPTSPPSVSAPPVGPSVGSGSPSGTSSPGGPTAICNDGTTSYSAHAQGTCSHHGGVAQWVNHP